MAASSALLVATRKGLLIYQRSAGGAWELAREAFVGVRATYALRDPRTGALWCCLDHGHWGVKLQRSDDLGRTWEERPAPAFAEGTILKEDKLASVSYLWSLAPGGADQPGRLYIGTVPGGLFVSDDDGASWSLCEPLWNDPSRATMWFGGGMPEAGIHSILVDPRDSRTVRVGVSCAGMFETTDDGRTWRHRNRGLKATFLPDPNAEVGHDAHLIVQCAGQPDVFWQQNHCGVFRTADAGGQWDDISQPGGPAHFGFTVACDAADGRVAWIVPAEADERRVAIGRALCVCRTTDGGRSWQPLSEGLPQAACYDFAFRHGLDVDGNRLALGTSGGSLYVSDDRGDRWQTLAKDLAPVYSVRFCLA